MTISGRVAVVGAGISGLAAAHSLTRDGVQVVVLEAGERVGGKIRTTPFAGLPAVDEGADAFLARLPAAVGLATAVGLGDELTSPATGRAWIWWNGMHAIPAGLMGVPTRLGPFARSGLLPFGAKVRAASEPLRRRTPTTADSLGGYVRARLGDAVHERLVDPLVGSIYATDTDHFALAAVPQIADLARDHRSLLLGARRRPAAPAGPVFLTPRRGMGALVDAVAAAVTAAGGVIHTARPAGELAADGRRWRVDGEPFDAVVLACPAAAAAGLLGQCETGRILAAIETADVALVTAAVPAGQLPERCAGISGYLVPKPVQADVTAASFGSQKWFHWALAGGRQLLRISLGRDGVPVLHRSDAELVDAAMADTQRHLGADLSPTEVRVSRWAGAFPQYRPHHFDRVARASAALPAGLYLAGASYHGIGVPACVRSGNDAAAAACARLAELAQ